MRVFLCLRGGVKDLEIKKKQKERREGKHSRLLVGEATWIFEPTPFECMWWSLNRETVRVINIIHG